ncbi:MAG: radical SAM family heme chaperone HemW [Alphaproteobacteria bacterium]
MHNKLGLYVHYPFCKKKCPYCDFNSHVRKNPIDVEQYTDAYMRDLEKTATRINPKPLTSIFFGGGTPSLMPAIMVEKIIDKANELFGFTNDIEITLEANPTSVESKKFSDFKIAGVNRVSLGVQSLNDDALQYLGREHNSAEALQAVEIAQKHFSRWSFDMIYCRPNQTIEQWRLELLQAVKNIGGHISLYQLTIEDGTVFKRRFDKGEIIMPNDELSADMYVFTNNYLSELGYDAYEVSNYSISGDESKHNKLYWGYDDYIGIGAGAHGRITDINGNKYGTACHSNPEKWLKDSSYFENDIIDKKEQAIETILMGLRLKEGVSEQKIKSITGAGFEYVLDMERLKIAIDKGLIEFQERLKTTQKGRLTLNSVLSYILN